MDSSHLETLLARIRNGTISIPEGIERLRHFPSEDIPDACIDHQRLLRTGIPEVIFGETKSAKQIITIAQSMQTVTGPVLVTRVSSEKATLVKEAIPEFTYHDKARMLVCNTKKRSVPRIRGTILVICAGTSDIPVAEETRITAESMGHPVQTIYDAGVAGLHRLLNKTTELRKAAVIVVAAGMEGALPSVVGGLVSCPVIGVPTSIGYGTGTGGFAALLGMLNSCAPGLAVVNIDNGFGAACMAIAINRSD
ncbi:MAG: 1-(5-phosphoribosyl)-5-amino-4-imidazole-carboxylate carboxylase [Proteobacteria bacterium]|nr:MAG: 1-(5-phosphoribosyl)-5-amino-4-imidazole-carboxylate carboxylase [Pseudomonadota bacterium]PIE65297.1 MAG: 1-(5-phosphoribosyl)-5-amino-4-imidazole-carboxylate carboxylase [Desulfobacterales bacterium]